MNGYMGKFLLVDLTLKTSRQIPLGPHLTEAFVGGKGFGARLLYEMVPPGSAPLGPENVLMFMTGPLTGTLVPGTRGCVATRSPLTGTFVDSYFGGHFAPEIKYAGYDGLIITGKAARPVYLWIDDNRVDFRDAAFLWGKDTFATNEIVKRELQDPSIKVACIGPAGENQVRFALISCEYNRQAGRGGTGAVMGAKNLKAVAVRGSHGIKVYDQDRMEKAVWRAYAELDQDLTVQGFRMDGTPGSLPFANAEDLLPTRNFQAGTFEKAHELYPDRHREELWWRDVGCQGCPIHCGKVGRIRTGRHAGLISDVVEYENASLLGANLGIGDIREVSYLTQMCDALGLDGMSTGGVVGFALEAFARGVIGPQDTGGRQLKFGDPDAAAYLIHLLARKEGRLGQILAEGVKGAAEILGGQAQDFAVHVKGLETPAWGPRSVPGMALAYATGDRGGCHQRAFPILYEVGGTWCDEPVDRLGTRHKAEIVTHQQNYLAALDTFVKCDFAQYGIKTATYLELLAAATGREMNEAMLLELGERVWNMVRLFNIREGFRRKDDALPRRFTLDPLPDGQFKGAVVRQKDLDTMLDEYYARRGWDGQGVPTPERLAQLGLSELPPLQLQSAV